MNLKQIIKASREVHSLIDAYSTDSAKKREMRQDPLLFGYFSAKFGQMSRQKYVYIGSGSHPKRIDFRYGGPGSVLLEFAVRPPDGSAELYGPSNKDELNKLTRFPPTKANLRVLLLFDFCATSIKKESLMKSYSQIATSPGRFDRYPVQVVYVHHRTAYRFIWKP